MAKPEGDGADRLGPESWLAAARGALAGGGVGAVRIEALARILGVTKGSFYWHFRDRDVLLRALLADWEAQRTDAVIRAAEAAGSDPAARLLHLFEAGATADDAVERSVRAWAAIDPAAAAAVARVDQRRVKHVRALFVALGFPDAAARARLAYLARLGTLVAPSGTAEDRLDAARAYHAILVRRV